MKNRWGRVVPVLLLALSLSAPLRADEAGDLRALRDTTLKLLNLLVEQGVITREKADALIKEASETGKTPPTANQPTGGAGSPASSTAQAGVPATDTPGNPAGSAAPVAPGVIRVPYIPESVKQQIREEVKQDVLTQAKSERWGEPGAFPDWLHSVTVGGEVRFRAQADRFPTKNVPNAPPQQLQVPAFGALPLANTSDPVNRLRMRARLGVTADLGDSVTAGVRLASGGVGLGTNGATESQTYGNYGARESVGFDLVYVTYHPASWFAVSGGRLGMPFFAPTSLVWSPDLGLEGAVLSLKPRFTEDFSVFATAGAFPILDVPPSPLSSARSKWLFGYQTGFRWDLPNASAVRFGTALYDYRRLEGIPNPDYLSTVYNGTAAPLRQGGNSVFDIDALANTVAGTQNYLIGLASKFRELNASASFDLGFGGRTHVMLDLDYVKNIGFKHDEILARTGLDLTKRTTGEQMRLAVGDPILSKRYAWQAYAGYRYVQRDAVVDAFTETDFHLGGTDAQGYFLGGEFTFEKNTTLRLRWFDGKQIDGLLLAIDVLQIDVTALF